MNLRIIKIISLIVLSSCVIYYLSNRISAYDLRFYQGKDDGYSMRFYSVVILSTIFFGIVSRKNKLRQIIFGFLVGIITCIISYLFCLNFLYIENYSGVTFHIVATIMFIVIFFVFEKFNIGYGNKKKL